MLAIRLGSYVVQDPSWGGVCTLPVPSVPDVTARFVHRIGAAETALDVPSDGVTVLSLSLFGLVKIDWTKGTP